MSSCDLETVLGKLGNDLLSQALRHSTIGAAALNGRVRDGIGFYRCAKVTKLAKNMKQAAAKRFPGVLGRHFASWIGLFGTITAVSGMGNGNDQVNRTISTGKLSTLLRLHTRPINVVVFHGSRGNARFEVGFPLRCIQRLSRPDIATLHCDWRHNRSTRGLFTPVLSY